MYSEIPDRGIFCTDLTEPVGRDLIFHSADRASEVNKKFIIWHLYLKQKRNATFDSIFVTWYTFVEENRKYQCNASFTLKTICRYRIINKIGFMYLLAFSFAI